MSHLSSMFGPSEAASHVRFQGYTLCKGCSRGEHAKHDDNPCHCDLCIEETA